MKHFDEFRMSIGNVAIIEMLREREELSWSGFDRHIGMCYGALKSEKLRCDLRDDWKFGSGVFGLESKICMSVVYQRRTYESRDGVLEPFHRA